MFPLRRCMELGMGVLGWCPADFWNATPLDLLAAVAGYSEANGGGRTAAAEAADRNSVTRMKAWLGSKVKADG